MTKKHEKRGKGFFNPRDEEKEEQAGELIKHKMVKTW